MGTVNDVLSHAAREIGYTESPPGSNRTKFAAEAGHVNGRPWCATFVVAMLRRAGVKVSRECESAYTPTMAGGYKAVGAWTFDPQPGDLAFFDFPDSVRRIQHVGIVVSAASGTVTCIEGNTSSGPDGSQDNGGGVYRRTRSKAHIVGFGRPPYVREVKPMFDPPHALEPIVADLACPTGGAWLVASSGAVYAYGGAPYHGGANGKDYFAGRKAARLELVTDHPTYVYRIVATSGEKYGYPE